MLRLARLTLVIAALGLLAAACGDDDDGGEPLSLTDYFTQLEMASDDFNARAEELSTDLDGRMDSAASLDDVFEVLEDGMSRYEDAFNDFEDTLDSLVPPAEASDAHGRAVAALADVQVAASELADLASDGTAATTESIDGAFATFGAASDELNQACEDLQSVADTESIAVDLGCPGGA